MIRHKDREMKVIKDKIYTLRSLETGCRVRCRSTWGSTRVIQEAERVRGKQAQSLYCGFCGKGWARWGRYAEQA